MTPTLADSEKLVLPENVIYQKIEAETVVLNVATQEYFSLDAIGTHMWQAILAEPSLEAAAQSLCTVYEVDQSTLRQDLIELAARLETSGLLVRR